MHEPLIDDPPPGITKVGRGTALICHVGMLWSGPCFCYANVNMRLVNVIVMAAGGQRSLLVPEHSGSCPRQRSTTALHQYPCMNPSTSGLCMRSRMLCAEDSSQLWVCAQVANSYHVRVLVPCYKETQEMVAATVQAAYNAKMPAGCDDHLPVRRWQGQEQAQVVRRFLPSAHAACLVRLFLASVRLAQRCLGCACRCRRCGQQPTSVQPTPVLRVMVCNAQLACNAYLQSVLSAAACMRMLHIR